MVPLFISKFGFFGWRCARLLSLPPLLLFITANIAIIVVIVDTPIALPIDDEHEDGEKVMQALFFFGMILRQSVDLTEIVANDDIESQAAAFVAAAAANHICYAGGGGSCRCRT